MSQSGKDRILGVGLPVSRRDFVNGALAATALATIPGCASGKNDPFAPSGSAWTGFGGEGDYQWSNGNTEAVMNAAHGIRDGLYAETKSAAASESCDVIVVGGGFSGMAAAYEFAAKAKPGQSLLLLENHPIFGGEAKENRIRVGDQLVTGPQGSNGGILPEGDYTGTVNEDYVRVYRDLGLPETNDLLPLAGGAEKLNIAEDHYLPMIEEASYPTGYFFPDRGWVKNPIAAGFAGTPWTETVRKDLTDFNHNARDLVSQQADPDHWLDTMTYRELLLKLGYAPEVCTYVDPLLGVANFGVCSDAVSARAAQMIGLPGTVPAEAPAGLGSKVISFAGGNAAIMRAMVQRMIPQALPGTVHETLSSKHPMKLDALDRPGTPVRIRLSSTVIRVEHDGKPGEAGGVFVTYVRDGKVNRVKAKAVVMATGGWVSRRVVADLSDDHAQAYGTFKYGPALSINVAVRNWRFFERLGISNARWFEGLGWHICVRRNQINSGELSPLTPDNPIMLTFYVPVLFPGAPPEAQGALARQKIFETPFLTYERQIRQQMADMFGPAGFDAQRDIAGIIVNRWGHAFSAPSPGFFNGIDGGRPPRDVIRTPHGRIVFAHSELHGRMAMRFAMNEGTSGMRKAMAML